MLEDVLDLADTLARNGHENAAVAALTGALEGGCDAAPIRLRLGRMFRARGRHADARDHLARCAALDPGCAEAFRLLAELALEQGDLVAAELMIRDALAIAPEHPRAVDLAEQIGHQRRPPRRQSFGSYLVKVGLLAPHELHAAMDYHRRSQVRVGDAARALGLASGPKLEWAALAYHAGWSQAA